MATTGSIQSPHQQQAADAISAEADQSAEGISCQLLMLLSKCCEMEGLLGRLVPGYLAVLSFEGSQQVMSVVSQASGRVQHIRMSSQCQCVQHCNTSSLEEQQLQQLHALRMCSHVHACEIAEQPISLYEMHCRDAQGIAWSM